MKGIILAGGFGSRLYPLTLLMSKQLLPVYDKPMIYYPLSTLMETGIREILIISDPVNLPRFKDLLGDGHHIGMDFQYKVQEEPKGLAQAFTLGKGFIGKDNVCLVLGDNIFYGSGFISTLKENSEIKEGARIFGYWVSDPERYGVVEFQKDNSVISIVEKPKKPRSNYAVPGLYFYDNQVVEMAENLQPSPRGELEITDIHKIYLEKSQLKVSLMELGTAWLDTGTHDSLIEASTFIQTIEKRQGLKVGCIEEIAYRNKFIDESQFNKVIDNLPNNSYKHYLSFIKYHIDYKEVI